MVFITKITFTFIWIVWAIVFWNFSLSLTFADFECRMQFCTPSTATVSEIYFVKILRVRLLSALPSLALVFPILLMSHNLISLKLCATKLVPSFLDFFNVTGKSQF